MLVEEIELIALIRQKNRLGFDYLYDNYSKNLFLLIINRVKCHHTSCDILQETFITIYEKFDQYDPARGRLYTWLINLTSNKVTDYLRGKLHHTRSLSCEIQEDIVFYKSTDTIGVSQLITKLHEKYQPVIKMIYFKGYTLQEVADELDMPLGTVKTRLRKGLSILRNFYVEPTFLSAAV